MRSQHPKRVSKALWAGTSLIGLAIVVGTVVSTSASANDTRKGEGLGNASRTPVDFFDAPVESSAAQRELLLGGVTRDEYLAAFDSYRVCMERAGHPLVGVKTELEVIEYSITDTAVQEGVHQLCYPSEFYDVDLEWQIELDRVRG